MRRWLVNLPKKYKTTAHILWAVVVFGLHAMPSKSFPKISFWENLGPDKVVHAFMFFIGSSLAVYSGWDRMKSAIVWICAGVLLEYYQFYFTTDRSFDWFDATADGCGVIIALLLFRKNIVQRGTNH
jgi:hypothetical protein